MDSSISQNMEPALPKPASPVDSLEAINRALDDLTPLASSIDELKQGLLDKESEILKVILQKITPLIPLFDEGSENYHRGELIILEKNQCVEFEEESAFYSDHILILYENGALIDKHCYGEKSSTRVGWEIVDDIKQTPMAAITAYGLDDIVEGLAKILDGVRSIYVLKSDMEERITALMNLLEALQ